MFVRNFTVVDMPFARVEAQFLRGADRWLPGMASEASGHGNRLLSELGFKVGPRRLSRRIAVKVGTMLRSPGVTMLPLKWRAASADTLFPVLDGQIEIASLGPNVTQVGVSASYEPPMGWVGRLADRALLHRVAEVTIQDFVERVGEHVGKG